MRVGTGWPGVVVAVCAACDPGEPTLALVAPGTLDALGRTTPVRVVATMPGGSVGVGTVTLTASVGSLDETSFTLDSYGTARTTFACPSVDPECVSGRPITLEAAWKAPGATVSASRTLRIAQPPLVWTPSSCPDEAKLVYLFTDVGDLYSFDPPRRALTRVGRLSCPAPSGVRPNSMAVSQEGTGWVNYSDGSLFRVNVRTVSCASTSFTPLPGWTRMGMGFSPDAADSVSETLFIASEQGLAKVDLQAMRATMVGPFTGVVANRAAELTGTTEGGLYGFFLPATAGDSMQLARVVKETAATSQAKTFPTLVAGSTSFAYAFSSWGPDFYLYTSSDGAPSTITLYSPASDLVSTAMTAPSGVRILGAGVSRCGAQ